MPSHPTDGGPTDGGNAFPLQCHLGEHRHGMSLRDYFAAKSMEQWLTADLNYLADRFGQVDVDRIADCAYVMADAMLRARTAQPSAAPLSPREAQDRDIAEFGK